MGKWKPEYAERAREYKRAKRREAGCKEYSITNDDAEGAAAHAANRAMAAYDPMRDGLMVHFNLTAMLMGDPPIGRRAIDDTRRKTVEIDQQTLSPESKYSCEGARTSHIKSIE